MVVEAQLVRTGLFSRGVPRQFAVDPTGTTALFLRARSGDDPVDCLWSLTAGSGTARLIADPRVLAPGTGAGITEYATDRALTLITFALNGQLWAVSTGPQRLPATGVVEGPLPDPTGRRIAYRSARAVRVIDATGADDRLLAEPDGDDVELGRGVHTDGRGCWWAPDGERLLLARADWAPVARWYLPDPAEPRRPPRAIRHAAAGAANADVSLRIAGLNDATVEVRWDRSAYEYVCGAGWDGHGPWALVQSRDQRTTLTLGIDPDTGGTDVLERQEDRHWVQVVPGLPARTASGLLVSHRDRDATRHLTVGAVPVTPTGLQLRAVVAVDGDEVVFTASEDPAETHLWSCRPGRPPRRLSSGPGVHTGTQAGGTLVRRTAGGGVRIQRRGGAGTTSAGPAEPPLLAVRPLSLVLGRRRLRARLHLPSWHRPGDDPLPVLVDPYGGAARQRVTSEVTWHVVVSQWFAEQGFAVLAADGRGTPGRGPAWERAAHGDLFGPAVEDQVCAVREAAEHHRCLDRSRVGIRGWSFGGSLAMAAVIHRPDVFHAAVAGAGVTDQRLYDAHWRERFLGHPSSFPERYARSSLVRAAPALSRPLLLIHGLADDNVHPANTLSMSQALLAAGRQHETLLLPGAGHQPMGGPLTGQLLSHQLHFLRRHLAPPARNRTREVTG